MRADTLCVSQQVREWIQGLAYKKGLVVLVHVRACVAFAVV